MKNLLNIILGYPIWTIDFDGSVRRRLARRLPDGRILTHKIAGKLLGNPDGTFGRHGYVRQWLPRDTWWGLHLEPLKPEPVKPSGTY